MPIKKKTQNAFDTLDTTQQTYKEPINNKKSPIVPLLITILTLLLVLTGVGVFLLSKTFNQDQKVAPIVNIKEEEPEIKEDQVYLIKSPVTLPDWARKEYDTLSKDEYEKMLEYSNNNTFIGWYAEALPSEQDGFTSDISKIEDENGVPNVYYTSMTKESFNAQLSFIMYRITNPIFGNWIYMQKPHSKISKSEILENALNDITTLNFNEEFLNNNVKMLELDFNDDYYNNTFSKDSKGILFVGIIKDGSIVFNDDDTYNVEFTVDYMVNDNITLSTKQYKLHLVKESGILKINGGGQVE